MELARDPLALLGGRLGRASMLLAVECLGASLEAAPARPKGTACQRHPHGEDGETRPPHGLTERVDQRICHQQAATTPGQRQRQQRCAPDTTAE